MTRNMFLLVCVLCFVPSFASAQQPITINGPDGITVTRGPVVEAADERTETLFRKSKFHTAMEQAIRKARRDGNINLGTATLCRVKLLVPVIRKWAESNAIDQVLGTNPEALPFKDDGTVDKTAIEWGDGQLLDFLERFIPILLQIIEIFNSMNPNP
jgi:hypothetical protein